MIEVVSMEGSDNLLLPLLTYGFVRYNAGLPIEIWIDNFIFMLFLLVIIVFVYKLTNISRLSVAYSLLVGYIVLILGGLLWIIPPLTLLLMFGILPMMKSEEKQMLQSYKAIECNTIAGVVCLYLAVFYPQYRDVFYLAFSFSFACHLAINTYSRFVNFVKTNKAISIIVGLGKGFTFIAFPAFLITRMNWVSLSLYLIFIVAAIPTAVVLNDSYDYKNVNRITARANKILVSVLTAVYAATLIVIQEVSSRDLS